MPTVTDLFDRMDAWRHLPGWQLERRADLFFSLTLRPVLETVLDRPLHPVLVPELPLRTTVLSGLDGTDLSASNVDYFAIAADRRRAFLIELKTDARSRRDAQDADLQAARAVGLAALLQGVVDIVVGPRSRSVHRDHKYAWLVHQLVEQGCLRAPEAYRRLVHAERRVGLTAAARQISVPVDLQDVPLDVVYVQPEAAAGEGSLEATVVSFERYAEVLRRAGDPMSLRFAESLRQWQRPPAEGSPWSVER